MAVTFWETEFFPYEPQPSVSDGINPLYISPIPPCDEGAFTMRRQAFIRNPNCFCTSLFVEWITAECPKPPRFNISSQYVNPSSNEFAFTQANTGLSFSRDNGYAAPIP